MRNSEKNTNVQSSVKTKENHVQKINQNNQENENLAKGPKLMTSTEAVKYVAKHCAPPIDQMEVEENVQITEVMKNERNQVEKTNQETRAEKELKENTPREQRNQENDNQENDNQENKSDDT